MRTLFYAAQFVGLAAWLAFCFVNAWQGGDWWMALFSFGLGAFMAQVAISFVLIKSTSSTPVAISEFQRRLSQFFVLSAAVGFFAIMINRYVVT
jgi:hypothetical protein